MITDSNRCDHEKWRGYSAAFSRSVFTGIGLYSDFSPLDELLHQYDGDFPRNSSYLDYLTYQYKQLVQYYPCEYVFKNELINQLLLKKYVTKKIIVFNEFKVGDSIVDLAMMHEASIAFEIKTPLDSPRRLKKQMQDYKKLFNMCYVVVDEDECDSYAAQVDENTGILALSYKQGSAILQEYKPARKQASPDTLTVLKCLRTREYESIIQRLCGRLPSVPSYRMYDACKELLCEVEPATLNRLFLEEIRKRKSPTGRLKSVPKELRQMILSLNLTQKKEDQLIAKLRSPIPWNRLEYRVSDPHIF